MTDFDFLFEPEGEDRFTPSQWGGYEYLSPLPEVAFRAEPLWEQGDSVDLSVKVSQRDALRSKILGRPRMSGRPEWSTTARVPRDRGRFVFVVYDDLGLSDPDEMHGSLGATYRENVKFYVGFGPYGRGGEIRYCVLFWFGPTDGMIRLYPEIETHKPDFRVLKCPDGRSRDIDTRGCSVTSPREGEAVEDFVREAQDFIKRLGSRVMGEPFEVV
ncbi:hypothetical protein BHE90_017581 [Fusarium euwallaceae]|uniref:Uncharacterized protein n=1 Tax=Fusarium euwallaceae TaxID=1147111 RepID=A0A430KX65_9HYPO|nr:hypothetical protein BHE90_017581 [Fusarium euwallaceae]